VWTAHLCELILADRLSGTPDRAVAATANAALPDLVEDAWGRVVPWLPMEWFECYFQRVVDLNAARRAAIEDLVARGVWKRATWFDRVARQARPLAETGIETGIAGAHDPERGRVAAKLHAAFVVGKDPQDLLFKPGPDAEADHQSPADLIDVAVRAGQIMLVSSSVTSTGTVTGQG
jgi:hypothetical protein